MIGFSVASGRYRNKETGRFVSRADVLRLVDNEEARLKTRLQGHTRLLLAKKIDVAEWEKRFATTIKESHIRMSTLGAGGKDNLTNAHFGAIGASMKQEYRYLNRFAKGIERGEYSERYILSRAKLYSASTKKSFYKGEQIARAIAGVRLAKRVLDPQSRHCADCPAYQKLDWVPIETIVPPGQACACGGRCRCSIIYKPIERNPINLSDRLEAIIEA